ncbi:MAG: flagellar assembly protein FliW [Porcipelethomonas sp.]
MKINTRDFGEIEINEADIIKFENKIFGFEEYTDFIIIYDDDFNGEIAWLQSVEEPGLCFIISNPIQTVPGYDPDVEKEANKALGMGKYEIWLMMVVKDDIYESTVNLRSPLVINSENNQAMQLILDGDYSVRYKLFQAGKE